MRKIWWWWVTNLMVVVFFSWDWSVREIERKGVRWRRRKRRERDSNPFFFRNREGFKVQTFKIERENRVKYQINELVFLLNCLF